MTTGQYTLCDHAGCRSLSDHKCVLCGKDLCTVHTVSIKVTGIPVGNAAVGDLSVLPTIPAYCGECDTKWGVARARLLLRGNFPDDVFVPFFESMKAMIVELDLAEKPDDATPRTESNIDANERDAVERLRSKFGLTQPQALGLFNTLSREERLRAMRGEL